MKNALDARDALDTLVFENRFLEDLPGDSDETNRPRQVFGAAWSPVLPTPVAAPRLLAWSREAGALLGLTEAEAATDRFARVFGGNELLPGMRPWAAAYGGHQFGHWAGQLGDGRAISLGEAVTPAGARWELQLKGAGPTPYARRADGRAVLRSSIREFLCSEAMHHLGVPTTRALSLVGTGESVVRDMLYDGNPAPEPGAVVCRMAPSFLRFGNYQLFASRGEHDLLARLVDFTIARDFPWLHEAFPDPGSVGAGGGDAGSGDRGGGDAGRALAEARTLRRAAWVAEVARRTADLMVHWMRVGFVHGVMNTDNLSVLGITIDYGPYGWLDDFDPDWTPNTTDAERRRYRFGQQPAVAQWNLVRFAEAILPLFPDDPAPLQAALVGYVARYNAGYRAMSAAKLGLVPAGEGASDGALDEATLDEAQALIRALHPLLHQGEVDYTRFFRALGEAAEAGPASEHGEGAQHAGAGEHGEAAESGGAAAAAQAIFDADVFYDPAKREAVAGDLTAWIHRWRGALHRARGGTPPSRIRAGMDRVNPRIVLRNWLAQEAIDLAEGGDLSRVHALLDAVRTPYDRVEGDDPFSARRPEWARHRVGCSMLSCSS